MAIATVTTIAGANSVTCAAGESAEFGFNISNDSPKSVRLSIQTHPEGDTQPGWLTVRGDIERELPGAGTDHVTVRVNLPEGTPEGKYTFRLRVYATDDPEQVADSPTVAIEVPVPTEPPPVTKENRNPFPWWIVAVVVTVLVIGGVVAAVLLSGSPKGSPVADLPPPIEAKEAPSEDPCNVPWQQQPLHCPF